MSEPSPQMEHWHSVKQNAQKKIKEIYTTKRKTKELPFWRNLLSQSIDAIQKLSDRMKKR